MIERPYVRLFERYPRTPARVITLDLVFEPRDLWIGLYWTPIERQKTRPNIHFDGTPEFTGEWIGCDVYLCLVPMLPLRLQYRRHRRYR